MSDLLLTAAQMRAWERAAIESRAVTGLELMEHAGAGAVDAILAEWPELGDGMHRAVVLCGPGNNGGDGFVVARLLRGRGWVVQCFLYGDAEKLPADARTNYERWREHGVVEPLAAHGAGEGPAPSTDLIIDAIFGIGQTRALPTAVRQAMCAHSASRTLGGPHFVSLDVVSGYCSDTGNAMDGDAVGRADLAVAFGAAKPGHYLSDQANAIGKLVVVELPLATEDEPPDPVLRLTIPRPGVLKNTGHKYDHGHALVLAGGFGRTGAARLAARAALRIGAGLVTVGAPGAAMMECAAQLTAIMLRRAGDGDALRALLKDDRLNALCLGPGLGTDDRARGLVRAALEARRGTVLDADALTLLSAEPALLGLLHDRVVLTPHMGEFGRLAPDLAARLDVPSGAPPAPDPWERMRTRSAAAQARAGGTPPRAARRDPKADAPYSKVDAARDAAARLGCTVLLKGPDTVIAGPDGHASVNAAAYDRAAPWLATAGAGDVLSGMIAGLLARGMTPHIAGESAAWLHVEAALRFGPGLIAEDLPDAIPAALRALEERRR